MCQAIQGKMHKTDQPNVLFKKKTVALCYIAKTKYLDETDLIVTLPQLGLDMIVICKLFNMLEWSNLGVICIVP